jgi:hypothetical protein
MVVRILDLQARGGADIHEDADGQIEGSQGPNAS